MAYSEALAARVRLLLVREDAITEKKMFGGLCVLAGGRMVCGVMGDALLARVDPAEMPALLKRKGVTPMTFTGRAMKGFVVVSADVLASDRDLLAWIERGRAIAAGARAARRRATRTKRPAARRR